jgi:hypothetical protein
MRKIFIASLVILAINFFCPVQLPSAEAGETQTFVGTIESFRPVMGRPPKWYFTQFTAVADNGEKKEIWILGTSGASPTSVTDFDGKPIEKPRYNHRPQVGKKVEVKYSVAENGRSDAVSIRYVPADYVIEPAAPMAQGYVSSSLTAQFGNTVIGRIDKVLPIPPRFRTNHNCVLDVVPDSGEKYISFALRNAALTYFDGKPLAVQDLKKGERVEVKYPGINRTSLDGIKEAMAISVRYIPADYVPQPPVQTGAAQVAQPAAAIASEGLGRAAKDNIFVGKVVKGGVTFSLRCPYRFVIVTDNGETKDIWIPRDGLTITDVNGKPVVGAPPRKGKRMEIKYLVGDNGQYEAVSMRYVP